MASDPVCGQKWRGSLAKYNPSLSLWKTAQRSLLADSDEFLETWPKWGSMRTGECWELTTWAPRIYERGYGLWPTPTAQDNNQVQGIGAAAKHPKRGTTLGGFVRMFPTATAGKGWSRNHNRAQSNDRLDYTIEREAHEYGQIGRLNPEFCEWLMGWPIGWSALKPLAMDKFREWRQQHSPSSATDFNESEGAKP